MVIKIIVIIKLPDFTDKESFIDLLYQEELTYF